MSLRVLMSAILFSALPGCATSSLKYTERGNLIAKKDENSVTEDPKYEATFSIDEKSITANIALKQKTVTSWKAVYQLNGVFEEAPADWAVKANLVKYESPSEVTKPIDRSETKEERSERFVGLPLKASKATLRIGDKSVVSQIWDEKAYWQLRDFSVNPGDIADVETIHLKIEGSDIDATSALKEVAYKYMEEKSEQARAVEQERIKKHRDDCVSNVASACTKLLKGYADDREYAMRAMCKNGNKEYCTKLANEFPVDSNLDIANILHPQSMQRFEYGVSYSVVAAKVIQKIPKGYLISPNIPGEFNIFGSAFLETSTPIQVQSTFCTRVLYAGEYTYVTALRALNTVPRLKLDKAGMNKFSTNCYVPALEIGSKAN